MKQKFNIIVLLGFLAFLVVFTGIFLTQIAKRDAQVDRLTAEKERLVQVLEQKSSPCIELEKLLADKNSEIESLKNKLASMNPNVGQGGVEKSPVVARLEAALIELQKKEALIASLKEKIASIERLPDEGKKAGSISKTLEMKKDPYTDSSLGVYVFVIDVFQNEASVNLGLPGMDVTKLNVKEGSSWEFNSSGKKYILGITKITPYKSVDIDLSPLGQ